MIKDILKSVVPGFIAILGGAALSVPALATGFASDIATHSLAAPASHKPAWNIAAISGNFQDSADNSLLDNLKRLASSRLPLTGADAAMLRLAQAAPASPQPGGSIVVLGSPRIDDYWISATRQSGGVVVFDGYAPDEATRDAFAATAGADASWLQLGSGAPPFYRPAVDFGLAALGHMSEGRFALRANIITLSGIARSGADYDALNALLATGVPQGLVLARSEVTSPVPSSYLWSATKSGTGAVVLAGRVPTDALKRVAAVRAGGVATDNTIIDPAAPAGFGTDVLAGLDALALLSEGEIRFDGTTWAVAGTLPADGVGDRVQEALATAATPAAAWTLSLATVAQPAPAEAAAEPAVEQPALPPETPVSTPAETDVATAPEVPVLSPAAVDGCRADIAAFSARNAILFRSGAAVIAADSEAALDELAGYLAGCPDTPIDIEGYTDADGDDALNLALSVARAEAVVNALVARNISPSRLYAVGYGESSPIADNDTAQGKQLNRRIVVAISDEQEPVPPAD